MPSLNAARTSLSVNRFFHRVFAIGESSSRHPTRAVPGRTRLLRVAGGRVDYCTAEEVMAEKKRRRGVAWGVFGHPTTSSLFYYWIPYQKPNGGRYVRSGTECLFIDPEVEHSVVEAKYLRVVFKRHNRIRNEKCDVTHPPILHPVTSPPEKAGAGVTGRRAGKLPTCSLAAKNQPRRMAWDY